MKLKTTWLILTSTIFINPVFAVSKKDKVVFEAISQEIATCTAYFYILGVSAKSQGHVELESSSMEKSSELMLFNHGVVLSYIKKKKAKEKNKSLLREKIEILKFETLSTLNEKHAKKCTEISKDPNKYSENRINNHYNPS